jgi:hypothetical protein
MMNRTFLTIAAAALACPAPSFAQTDAPAKAVGAHASQRYRNLFADEFRIIASGTSSP